MRKVLENRSLSDEERMDALENQLKEARFLAEEADRKYDEASETILLPQTLGRKNYTDLRDLIFYLQKNSFYVTFSPGYKNELDMLKKVQASKNSTDKCSDHPSVF